MHDSENGLVFIEPGKLVLQEIWEKDNKLISRHGELQVRSQQAIEESRLEFKSEVTTKDEYLEDIMKLKLSSGR